MSTKIRLKRIGTKKRPFYRIVVVDSRSSRDGRVLEEIGIYHPLNVERPFEIKQDRVKEWLDKGAIPSDVVRKYLGRIGVLPAVDFSKKPKKLSKEEEKKKTDEADKAVEAGKETAKKAKEEKAAKDAEAAQAKPEAPQEAVSAETAAEGGEKKE
ncbi:MAG: 30S ribosomal protein S16 [bacterium]